MRKNQLNMQVWMKENSSVKCTTDELFARLKNAGNKIVILDGYSGCGKTMLLRRLREALPETVHIFSDEQFIEIVIERNSPPRQQLTELLNRQGNIICIEDVDLYAGRFATQEEVARHVKMGAQRNLIILTGNDMYERVSYLLERVGGEVWHTQRDWQDRTRENESGN